VLNWRNLAHFPGKWAPVSAENAIKQGTGSASRFNLIGKALQLFCCGTPMALGGWGATGQSLRGEIRKR